MPRITKKTVDDLKSTSERPRPYIWDEDVKGFGVQANPTGVKVYLFQYRKGGRSAPVKRYTIGKHGNMTADQARRQAKILAGKIEQGADPQAEKIESRVRGDTVKATFDAFEKRHLSKLKSYVSAKRYYTADILPAIGHKQLTDIKRRDLIDLIGKIAERGALVHANRIIAHLTGFFNWCVSVDRLETSPATLLKKPTKEKARARFLSDDEIVAVWRGAESMPPQFCNLIKLLLLTGQRLNEVAKMTWAEIGLDASIWTLPGARTKNTLEHLVHLSDPALRILKGLPRIADVDGQVRYVLTTTGQSPISGFSKWKLQLDTAMKASENEIPHWSFHDLRRTLTTGMAERLGTPPHIADKVLNHKSGSIQGVALTYNRAAYLAERKEALDAWAAYIGRLLNPPSSVEPNSGTS
jgi:integrase